MSEPLVPSALFFSSVLAFSLQLCVCAFSPLMCIHQIAVCGDFRTQVFFEVAPWPSLEAVIAVVGENGKGRRRVQAVAEALAEVREIRKEIEANKTCAATLGHPHEYMEGVCTMCAGPEKQEEDEEEVPRVTDLVDVEAIRKEQLQDVAVIATDLSGFTRLTKVSWVL